MVSKPDPGAYHRSLSLLAVVAILGIAYYLLVSRPLSDLSRRGLDILPPESGDGVDYEHIAFNVSEGRGYSVFWNDDTWRSAFLPYQELPAFRGIVDRKGELRPTAYRPPLYPLLLATVYEAIGRNFFFPRLINFWCIWAGVLLAAYVAWRTFGKVAAVSVIALAACDRSLSFWSYYFLTEPLSFFLCGVFLFSLIEYSKLKNPGFLSVGAGLVFGLLVLTRSIAILWLPAVIFCIFYFPVSWRLKARYLAIFLFSAIVPISVWVGRNVSTIGPSAYFGTQSGVNFAADYSDPMIRSGGVWVSPVWNEVRQPFSDDPVLGKLDGLERELAADAWGKRQGMAWIRDNLSKVPQLMWLKVKSLWWRDIQTFHLYLAFACLASIIFCRSRRHFVIPLLLVFGNTISVALTHNVPAGRFLFLMLPCLYVVAAALAGDVATRIAALFDAEQDKLEVP